VRGHSQSNAAPRIGVESLGSGGVFLARADLDLRLSAQAQTLTAHQQLAIQIYKDLFEINTISETGDTRAPPMPI
jgi:hypothetical protein